MVKVRILKKAEWPDTKPGVIEVAYSDNTRVDEIKKHPEFQVGDKMDVEYADGRLYGYQKLAVIRSCKNCGYVYRARTRVISLAHPPFDLGPRGQVDEYACPNPLCQEEPDHHEPHNTPWKMLSETRLGKNPHFLDDCGRPVSFRDMYVGIVDDSSPEALRAHVGHLVLEALDWAQFTGDDDDVDSDPIWKTVWDIRFWPPVQEIPEAVECLQAIAKKLGISEPSAAEIPSFFAPPQPHRASEGAGSPG